MATSEYTDDVETAASIGGVAHIQGQPPLKLESENAAQPGASVLDQEILDATSPNRKRSFPSETLVDVSSPKRQGRTASMYEGALKIQNTNTYDNNQQQGAVTAPQYKPPECMPQYSPCQQPPPHKLVDLHLESPSREIEGTGATLGSPLYRNILVSQSSESHHPAPPDITEELHGTENILSPALMAGTSDQSSRKGILKDIFLEFSSPHQFSDELTLVVMRSVSVDNLRLAEISPTKWKAIENIECECDAGDIMLVVHSKERGDEGFLTLTADEIYAMTYTEEDTPVEHLFASVKVNSLVAVKMTSTVVSSSTVTQGDMDVAGMRQNPALLAMAESALTAWRNVDAFRRRFEETGDVEDITQVISHCERAIALVPPGFNVIPEMSDALGTSYLERYERTGDLHDIGTAISHHQKAVESTPSGHADLPSGFNNLGNSYLRRFERTGDIQDIEYAISHHQKAVESTPSGHAHLPIWFNSIGISYSRRFERTGDLQDIDYAISHLQKSLESTPSGHADLLSRFNNLGNSYSCRFQRTGDLQDIKYAISHHQKAVESSPTGHDHLPSWFNNLGSSYSSRFERTGDLQDIDYAIFHLQKSLESTPSGHANLPSRFNNLGISYSRRFECTGDLQNIEYAISHHQKAVESTPSGHADLPSRFNSLGNSYSRRFERTGDLQDIDYAISHLQKALESTPSGHALLPDLLNNLGISYSRRFKRTGDIQDIEYAISHLQKALESTPSGHADLPSRFKNLGNSYSRRFECTGDLQDIEYAISHHQKAVESTPSGHADLLSRFNSLGNSYLCRFERTGDLQDIDYAISHLQKAVESTPSGHAHLPSWFNNLGNSYLRRFERTGDIQDIEYAISHHQKAVESTPSGHADLPSGFNNLGNSYLRRFERTGDIQDIEYAISHHQKAVESTPSGHADLPSWFNNLGISYSHRFECTNHFLDVQNSITSYRRGAVSNGTPSIRLMSARNAAIHSSAHDQSRCLVDLALAISLLSEVAGLEQTIHRRYASLQGHTDFVKFAVATALDSNRPDLALEWLEQGRCLVWNQLNQLRTPIEDLRIQNPSLADRFVSAASALESYGSRSTLPISSSDVTLADEISCQNDTQNHTLHAVQYRQLLDEIRALPDFNHFLRPPKISNKLSSLPSNGPVIVFNLHKSRCDALALISGIENPVHIPLDDFSLDKAEQLLNTLQFDLLKQREAEDQDRTMPQRVKHNPSSMSYVLKELWYKVVQPILEVLGYSLNFSDRRRIWWCPTGPLTFLPLHAAGIYDSPYTPGSCISDFAVSSYTPTVQSLNEKFSASSAVPSRAKLLLISPNTPSLTPIPFTAAETHDLKARMDQSGRDAMLLEDAVATADKVKMELNNHSWVHFACHGIQDVEDPLKSGVHLYNGRLELLEIMRQKISNPQLAFLSACQTSKGDLKLSEEVVHLTAGMLAAGYRGVVGTMWSISDLHGPEFAKHFYEYLLKEKDSEGLDSTQAAYALDYATRKVRDTLGEGDAAFLTWVPYVHFGY